MRSTKRYLLSILLGLGIYALFVLIYIGVNHICPRDKGHNDTLLYDIAGILSGLVGTLLSRWFLKPLN